MADEETINKYNIDEKKFVVVMVTKGKPAAPAATPAAPAPEPVEKKETKEESKAEVPAESKVKTYMVSVVQYGPSASPSVLFPT